MFDAGRFIPAAIYLLCLAVIFTGMSLTVVRMVQGPAPKALGGKTDESALTIVPPLILGILVLSFGLYLCPGLHQLFARAALVATGNG